LIISLSYGERGESGELWSLHGQTLDAVKSFREAEATKAASVLGAAIDFLDLGDYMLHVDNAALEDLARRYREFRPDVILTHAARDPYNEDHAIAAQAALRARAVAQAAGVMPKLPVIEFPPIFAFEPHQADICDFKPDIYVDIDPYYEVKCEATACYMAPQIVVDYYERLSLRRGALATHTSGAKPSIQRAEAFQSYFPTVAGRLPTYSRAVTGLGDTE
jgi:4-oxalomesaconate hydratase